MSSIMRRRNGLIAWSVMGRLLSGGRVTAPHFRKDAPLISPHPTQLVAEPYRASGLVLWRKAVVHTIKASLLVTDADQRIAVSALGLIPTFFVIRRTAVALFDMLCM